MTAPKPFTADERAVILIAASVSPNLPDGIREAFDRYEATVKDLEAQLARATPSFVGINATANYERQEGSMGHANAPENHSATEGQ